MTLFDLELIGFASTVEAPTLPRVLAPVFRHRTQGDFVVLPPFSVVGDEIFHFSSTDMAGFEDWVRQQKLTQLPEPLPAKVNHDLWVNPEGAVSYQPRNEVKRAFKKLYEEHLRLAEQKLADKEYESVCHHAGIARAANPAHLDPLLIRAIAERMQGQLSRYAFTRHLAEDMVSVADFEDLIEKRMGSESAVEARGSNVMRSIVTIRSRFPSPVAA